MNLEKWINKKDLEKIKALNNPKVEKVIDEYLTLCSPEKAVVIDDSPEDIAFVRQMAIDFKEEIKLAIDGHTVHYDGYYDQARDKKNTRLLVPSEEKEKYGQHINTIDRDEGLEEVLEIMDGVMTGKTAIIRFFSLGPTNSRFSICALQITDSTYVAHSEDLLYRQGYEEFKRLEGSEDFFYFIHSAGELTDKHVTKSVDKRRIYIDLIENRVFTVNNQYAGNSLGLKKLALRLAINKAIHEDWLTEHMFISAIWPLDKSRKTYFLGAYPSACGKTSTAMIPGNTIVGDDIAYLRICDEGEVRAVNIERGIFGIIKDVSPKNDPVIYNSLKTPRETIFSNILISEGQTYWLGMGKQVAIPETGMNWTSSKLGEWTTGMCCDEEGNEFKYSHPNARYTLRLEELENVDEALHDPNGVEVSGIIYGGRDSDTSVPVYECFSWEHGVYVGASIESETTAATLGKAGVRKHQPMANLDFIVVPLGEYLKAHLKFGERVASEKLPKIFSTNYFLRDEKGNYYDEILDKKIWLIWAEGRVQKEYEAIETPIGFIPKYGDLAKLFKEVFDIDYEKTRYEAEFSVRITKFLEKIERIENIFKNETNVPNLFFEKLEQQRKRLVEAEQIYGTDIISPFLFQA
ncbi:MAG: phosphoenolpyruvate carboxykinase (GTP) [Candidatus Heimdallarchaeota archaeon]|nr:phosphoenolpyruvate carboxykinase (GTP) [Candidatus Heimdallarchaeota archaeon]